jgi:vacuolar-type H+-ATPase subunit E/Vma4
MTNKEFFTAIAYGNDISKEVRKFAKQELAKLTANQKPAMTQTQRENEKLKQQIIEEMIEDRQYTITTLQSSLECCEYVTIQKLLALMRQLVADGKVIRKEKPMLSGGAIAVFILA